MTPGLSSMGVGSKCVGSRISLSASLVAGGSSYPDGSAGTVGRCNGLRMRSLKPRPVAVSNRPTVTPLSVATPASGANSTHPSPSARPFRLPFNGLAQSELRRIFCSDEGVLMRFGMRTNFCFRVFMRDSAVISVRVWSKSPSDLMAKSIFCSTTSFPLN